MSAAQIDADLKDLYRALADGTITAEAAEAAEATLHARRARPGTPKSQRPATGRRCGSRPRSSESLERRRRLVASGKMPPAIAARFTQAETAALAVVAAEVVKHGDCRLAVGRIAALAGICARSVRNALRAAAALGLLTIEERRLTAFRNDTNVVRVVDLAWRAWLRLKAGGCKTVQRTGTSSFYSAPPRPASMTQRGFAMGGNRKDRASQGPS